MNEVSRIVKTAAGDNVPAFDGLASVKTGSRFPGLPDAAPQADFGVIPCVPWLKPLGLTSPAPSIRIRIEQLVVDERLAVGGSASLLQAAIEEELSRLLVEQGLQLSAQVEHPLPVGNIEVSQPPRPGIFGRQIARCIHAALNKPSGPGSKGGAVRP